MDDRRMDGIIGHLLRGGVILSALVVIAGGFLYLGSLGGHTPSYRQFQSEPDSLRSIPAVMRDARALDPRGVIEFGIVLLILTPIARVAFSIFAFGLERDWIYVGITCVVLALLIYSFTGGAG